MSGPKVVRIVTREEILEICRGHLARVDAALADWTRVGIRNGCIDEQALAAANARRAELARLLASDRFMDVQKQAPIEEAFLRDDLQTRLRELAERQAASRTRERRERDAATSLLHALKAKGRPMDADLETALSRGDAGALARGFALLGAAPEATASETLAGRLREATGTKSLAEWLSTQPAVSADPAIERIDARIAELAQIDGSGSPSDWMARLEEAASALDARRALLLDGLEVETGRALAAARQRSRVRGELDLVLAELEAAGCDAAPFRSDTASLDTDALVARVGSAAEELRSARDRSARAARRAAVLEGLSSLGYEVAEGMSTSLVQEGRIVLRSAARPDYGVEVNANGERMQMRPVAFEAGGRVPDASRDRDAETIWCGDVSALQDRLADIGGGLAIEKSLPIGATPLKRISIETPDPGAAAAVPVLKARTLG